jgi:serine/threonine protein phosphatase 1
LQKPSEGRRFAISDIHGCANTFRSLLKQIRLRKKDQLFLLGDLINRGPGSNEVLDKVIELKKGGYQVFVIRGNHEQAILNARKRTKGQRLRTMKAMASQNLMSLGKLKPEYYQLLIDSYHYIELEHMFLVHAGFRFTAEDPFSDVHAMLNIRKFKVNKEILKGKKVVIGHTPNNLSTIIERIKKGKTKLPIDNGCVNYATKEQGNLICLDLDSMAITIQRNLDS